MNKQLLEKHVKSYLANQLEKDPEKAQQDLLERRERAVYYQSWTKERLLKMNEGELFEYCVFRLKTFEQVSTEMSLHVLAYNLKRVMNIIGIDALIGAIRAFFAIVLCVWGSRRRFSPFGSLLAPAN